MLVSPRALHIGALCALVAASFAVAGCGGGGSTPAPVASATPTASAAAPTPTPTASSSANPSFTFASSAGGTANITAGTGGQTLTSGASAVGGVSVSSTWGANNATTTVAMTAQLATGNGDITSSNSVAFPPFATTSVVDQNGNSLSGYTLVDYLKVTATPETTFTLTPAITVTIGAPASIAGKTTCYYFTLGGSVGNAHWQQALPGTITGGGSGVTFSAVSIAPNTVDIGNGNTNVAYLALACK